MFYGTDPSPEKSYYTTRAHLAKIIGLLGPPPLDLPQKRNPMEEFISEDGKSNVELLPCPKLIEARGKWIADCPIPKDNSLEKAEVIFSGRNKEMILDFVRGMPMPCPENRRTTKELLAYPWLTTGEIP